MITRKHSSRMRTARFCGWGGRGRVYPQIPYPVAHLRGALGMHAPESKFLQFHAVFGKILQNHKLASSPRELAPPPQRNPGSATAIPWIPCPLDTLPPQIPYPQYPTLQKGHETRDTLPCPPEGTWDRRYPTPPPTPWTDWQTPVKTLSSSNNNWI